LKYDPAMHVRKCIHELHSSSIDASKVRKGTDIDHKENRVEKFQRQAVQSPEFAGVSRKFPPLSRGNRLRVLSLRVLSGILLEFEIHSLASSILANDRRNAKHLA
jgi:hypothetical protein